MKFITKKLVGIMVIIIAFSIISVQAAEVKIYYDIDWDSDCKVNASLDTMEGCTFTIDWEGAGEHEWRWEDREDDEDADSREFWYEIDPDEEDNQIRDFGDLPSEKLLTEMVTLTKICSGIVNESKPLTKYSEELKTCEVDKTKAETSWEEERKDKIDVEDELSECKSSLDEKRLQLDSANNQITALNRKDTDYSECVKDLSDSDKSKQTTAIIWLGIGLGVGYFLWNKKKGAGPSEHAEMGSYSDVPDYRYYEQR